MDVYAQRGWRMFDGIERVYDNTLAREQLGWAPRHDFATAVEGLAAGNDPRSALTLEVGVKGYHAISTGIYTVRD